MDVPYEHNAGTPYEPRRREDGSYGAWWRIVQLAFDGPFDEPSAGHINSPYSVDMINRRVIPWLRPWSWETHGISIWAGASVNEFITLVQRAGGVVYWPITRRTNITDDATEADGLPMEWWIVMDETEC